MISVEDYLNPDVGQVEARGEVSSYDEHIPSGKPKRISRHHLSLSYLRHIFLRHTIVEPFRPELMENPVFRECSEKCSQFIVKRDNKINRSAAIFAYDDMVEGDLAWAALNKEFPENMSEFKVHRIIDCINHPQGTILDVVNTNPEWVLNELHFGVQEYREPMSRRLVLMENVLPEVTIDELKTRFPEVKFFLDVRENELSPDMIVLEFAKFDEARDFMDKNKRTEINGQRIVVDWYLNREKRQNHMVKRYTRRNAGKDTAQTEIMSNEERLQAVSQYWEAESAMKHSLFLQDVMAPDKLRLHTSFSRDAAKLRERLSEDCKLRKKVGKGIPEPEAQQCPIVRDIMSGKMEITQENVKAITKMNADKEKIKRELQFLGTLDYNDLHELNAMIKAGEFRGIFAAAKARAQGLPLKRNAFFPPMGPPMAKRGRGMGRSGYPMPMPGRGRGGRGMFRGRGFNKGPRGGRGGGEGEAGRGGRRGQDLGQSATNEMEHSGQQQESLGYPGNTNSGSKLLDSQRTWGNGGNMSSSNNRGARGGFGGRGAPTRRPMMKRGGGGPGPMSAPPGNTFRAPPLPVSSYGPPPEMHEFGAHPPPPSDYQEYGGYSDYGVQDHSGFGWS